MVKLGDRVKDKITGFEGLVICRAEYLNGCITLKVQPTRLTKEGNPVKADWVDEPQVELIKSQEITKAQPNHGPQDYPLEIHP